VRFVDSHLHLDGLDGPGLVSSAAANSTILVSCGIDGETSKTTLKLAGAFPETVRAFVGVHPSEAARAGPLDWLGGALERAAGLGEVGLDPKYSGTDAKGAQMELFLTQLEAAEGHGRPVQVHSRDAERECLDALGGFRLGRVLLHWFQGAGFLSEALGRGYLVSFGPTLLYSKRLQRMAATCEPNQVLTETDWPVSYTPLGGVRGPSLVPSVVFKLAELWGLRFEDARVTVLGNSMRFLGLSEKG